MKEQKSITMEENSISLAIESLFFIKYKKTLKEIKEFVNSGVFTFDNFIINKLPSYFSIKHTKEEIGEEIVWNKPIKLICKGVYQNDKEIEVIDNNVISTIQISNYIEFYKMDNVLMSYDGINWIKYRKYSVLYFLNRTDKLIIKNNKEIIKYTYNNFRITNYLGIEKNALSKYFKEYFKYDDNEEKIDLYFSIKREELIGKLVDFSNSEVNLFKLTGPSNTGKSISLLYFSRCYQSIVYLNLKSFKQLYDKNEEKKLKEMYFYELERIELSNDDVKNISNIINNNKNNVWIMLHLTIKKLIDKKIVFILDQFSPVTVDNLTYLDINNIIKGKAIKLIICSSINDNPMKDEVIKTLTTFKGNPEEINEKTQNYYYYYSDLLNFEKKPKNKISKKKYKLLSLFNFHDKYERYFKSEEISQSKLEEEKKAMFGKIDKVFKTDLIDHKYILINMMNYLNKEINYNQAKDVLDKTPLKYFKLDLNKTHFKIDYQFPFVKIISEDCLTENDIDNYFMNKEYEKDKKKEIKGYMFEKAVILKIKQSNFLPNEINTILKVNSIINFQEIKCISNEKKKKTSQISKILKKKKFKLTTKKRKRSLKKENRIKNIENLNEKNIIFNDINTNITNDLENESKDIETKDEEKQLISPEEIFDTNFENKLNEITNAIEEKKPNEDIKNDGILIVQKNTNSPILDLGFLYGNGNQKIFIGFQMKNYGTNTDLKEEDKSKVNKNYVLNSLNEMKDIVKNKYNIIIKEFHFVFVIYYNKSTKYKYNKKISDLCNDNDIEYILYDPVEKEFYDRHEKIIKSLELNSKTNLCEISKLNPYEIFENMPFIEFQGNDIVKCIKEITEPELYLKNMLNKSENKKDLIYKNFINNLMNLKKNIKDIKIIGIFEIKFHIIIVYPKDTYGLLFENKKNEYNYVFNFDNKIESYKISKLRLRIEKIFGFEAFKNIDTSNPEKVIVFKAEYKE